MATKSSAKQIQIPPPPSPWDFRVRVRVRKRGVLFRGFGSGFAIPRPFSEVLAEQSSDKKIGKISTSYDRLIAQINAFACLLVPALLGMERLVEQCGATKSGWNSL